MQTDKHSLYCRATAAQHTLSWHLATRASTCRKTEQQTLSLSYVDERCHKMDHYRIETHVRHSPHHSPHHSSHHCPHHPPTSLPILTLQPHSQPHYPASVSRLTFQPHSPASLSISLSILTSPTSLACLTLQPHSPESQKVRLSGSCLLAKTTGSLPSAGKAH